MAFDRPITRRSLITTTTLSVLGGSGAFLTACGGGGGGTNEGLLNYGSPELPTKAYGLVPANRSSSGLLSTTSTISLDGVATIVGGKSTLPSGSPVSLSASLNLSKAVSFIATVPADVVSRISYGIDVTVGSIADTGLVHVLIDLPAEMQSLDPNTIAVGAHIVFDDSEGFMAVKSTVSADRRTVAVDVPGTAFESAPGKFHAHLVVAEIPVSRKPGSRPVDYDADNQELRVFNPTGYFAFSSSPLNRAIEITSRVGMRESTNSASPKKHVGIDLRIDKSTRVLSVADGYVSRVIDFSRIQTGQGNFISIEHDGGFVTQYLHLASFDKSLLERLGASTWKQGIWMDTKKSVRILAGDILGIAGNTSSVNVPPHLHLNLVGSGSAWTDSINHFGVWNPEPLLQAKLIQSELISEFLFAYDGEMYKSGDTIDLPEEASKKWSIALRAKDSVFRNLDLPKDSTLEAIISDKSIADATVVNGMVQLVAKKFGKVTIRVNYKESSQSPNRAYGEITVNIPKPDTVKVTFGFASNGWFFSLAPMPVSFAITGLSATPNNLETDYEFEFGKTYAVSVPIKLNPQLTSDEVDGDDACAILIRSSSGDQNNVKNVIIVSDVSPSPHWPVGNIGIEGTYVVDTNLFDGDGTVIDSYDVAVVSKIHHNSSVRVDGILKFQVTVTKRL